MFKKRSPFFFCCLIMICSMSIPALGLGSLLFEDSFDFPSSSWKFDRHNWLFRDGYLAHDEYSIGAAYYLDGNNWTNYEWETNFRVTKFGNENASLLFFFRSPEVWSGYGLAVTPYSLLLSRYDGAWNERVILGQASLVVKPERWFNLKIQIQGNQIKVYVDDKLRIDAFDPDNKYTQGSVSYYTDYLTAEIDSTKVTELKALEIKTSKRKLTSSILDEDDSKWPGYKGPGEEGVGGAKHIVLYYTHHNWNAFDLLPYVAYGKRAQIDDLQSVSYNDWFFDTFLVLNNFGDSRENPTNLSHWQYWLDLLYGENKHLDSLNEAVNLARKSGVQGDDYKVKVILMIPYPSVEQKDFGDIDNDGISEDFSDLENRKKAINWFLDQALLGFDQKRYPNLELIGFYWFEEQISGTDGSLIKATSEELHKHNLLLYWIPMFDASGISAPKAYGFDAVMMQPNYFWPKNLEIERLARAAAMSRKYNLGVEIEFDGNAKDPFYRKRFYEYLDLGVHLGYMNESLLSYYEGGGDLLRFFRSTDEELYKMYQAVYEFVKGTYQPKEILEYN